MLLDLTLLWGLMAASAVKSMINTHICEWNFWGKRVKDANQNSRRGKFKMTKKSTAEIRELLNYAKLDFDSVENLAVKWLSSQDFSQLPIYKRGLHNKTMFRLFSLQKTMQLNKTFCCQSKWEFNIKLRFIQYSWLLLALSKEGLGFCHFIWYMA